MACRLAQGDGLPHEPRAGPEPAAVPLVLRPVGGKTGGEGVELEGQRRVAGGDELVVDALGGRSEVTGEANLRRPGGVTRVDHAEGDRALRRPARLGVAVDPAPGGPVTGLAAHPVAHVEPGAALGRRDVEGVAVEAPLGMRRAVQPARRLPARDHAEAARDRQRSLLGERGICLGMTILLVPGDVLILEAQLAVSSRDDAPVTVAGRAGAGAVVRRARVGARGAEAEQATQQDASAR